MLILPVQFIDETGLCGEDGDISSAEEMRLKARRSMRTVRTSKKTAAKTQSRLSQPSRTEENLPSPETLTAETDFYDMITTSTDYAGINITVDPTFEIGSVSSSDDYSTLGLESLQSYQFPLTTIHDIDEVQWPLEDPIEAHLYNYWTEKGASSLDILSSHNVFRNVVPRLALHNSMLMNAIFLVSAQQIQRSDPLYPAQTQIYHQKIMRQLIPYLAEPGSIDEATLLAAMMLRSYEETLGKE